MSYERPDAVQMNSEAELRRTAEIILRLEQLKEAERVKNNAPANDQSAEFNINLVELAYYLISKFYVLILGMLIGTIAMGMYATQRSVPIYSATAKLYLAGQQSNLLSMANLQMGTALTKDYQEVFRTWEVHQMVSEELGADRARGAQGMISVSNPDDTRVLYITARSTDAQLAADVANAYVRAAKRFITETMNSQEPSIFSTALKPTGASSISVRSYMMRGFLLGAVGAGGILVLIFLLDSRPKSTEDILLYGKIPTLAVLPANPYLSGKEDKALARYNRKRRHRHRSRSRSREGKS